MLKIGSDGIGDMYLGSDKIVKAYQGSDLVYNSITIEKTATPIISYVENANDVVITATGNGTVILYVGGVVVSNPYTINKTSSVQSVTVTATAQETDKSISDTATLTISIPAAEWPHIGTWQDGYKLGSGGSSIVADSSYILTPYYEVTPSHSIKFWNGLRGTVALVEMPQTFSNVSQRNDYWNMTSNTSRTITLKSSSYYVMMAILKSALGNAFIQDNTTGSYIFKGSNVS